MDESTVFEGGKMVLRMTQICGGEGENPQLQAEVVLDCIHEP